MSSEVSHEGGRDGSAEVVVAKVHPPQMGRLRVRCWDRALQLCSCQTRCQTLCQTDRMIMNVWLKSRWGASGYGAGMVYCRFARVKHAVRQHASC